MQYKKDDSVIKNLFIASIGIIGGIITAVLFRCDDMLVTLLIFMCIDYITGMVVAGVFKKSNKSSHGALESKAGWTGLCRKGMTLLVVLVAHRLDIVTGLEIIKDSVIIAFIVNEAISITENAGLMGVPIPSVIRRGIDVLKSKTE